MLLLFDLICNTIYRCDYAVKGVHMTVNKNVERIVNEFILATKPIGYYITVMA